MKTPKTPVAFSAVVAIVCTGVAVVVVWNVFGCGTRHEANLIEQFRADAFFATAPHDGTLVGDGSEAGSCNERDDGYIRGVTSVYRSYQTPAVYSFDELRRLFDQAAQAGGWSFEQDIAQSHPDDPNIGPGNRVTYCKQTGTEMFYASARSLNRLLTGPEGLLSVALNTGFMATPCGHNDHPGQTPSAR